MVSVKLRPALIAMAFVLTTFVTSAAQTQINTVQITGDTLAAAPSCIHYQVQGACFWLHCYGPFCYVSSTLKVSEYLPDVTVSVFNTQKSDAWTLPHELLDPAAYATGDAQIKAISGDNYGFGNATDTAGRGSTGDSRLKEVDVLGNPVANIFQPPLFIPSTAHPFEPYYLSMLDAASWQTGLTEMFYPQSLIPGDDDVGQFPYNVWGNVYPRTGFLATGDDAKAGAVIAQRAASIITNTYQPHIYNPLPSGSCGTQCTAYAALADDPNTVQWQMVYPTEQNSCEAFGTDYLTHIDSWDSQEAAQGDGSYVWVMWRHYSGCIQGGGKYLGSF